MASKAWRGILLRFMLGAIYPAAPLNSVSEPTNTSIDKPSELKVALDNRTFEIQMFWQRSNYFLVLITAIGVAVFSIKQDGLALVMAIFATASSYYWYMTNLGSKFWQESWEVEVVALAQRERLASFERPTLDIVEQVKSSFESSWTNGTKGKVHRFIDRQILKKPSVSYYMIMLSLLSTAVWTVVTIVIAARWISTFGFTKVLPIVCAIGGTP